VRHYCYNYFNRCALYSASWRKSSREAVKNGFAEKRRLLCRAIRYVATFICSIHKSNLVIYLYDHCSIGGRTTKIKLAAAKFIPEIIVFASGFFSP